MLWEPLIHLFCLFICCRIYSFSKTSKWYTKNLGSRRCNSILFARAETLWVLRERGICSYSQSRWINAIGIPSERLSFVSSLTLQGPSHRRDIFVSTYNIIPYTRFPSAVNPGTWLSCFYDERSLGSNDVRVHTHAPQQSIIQIFSCVAETKLREILWQLLHISGVIRVIFVGWRHLSPIKQLRINW